MGPSFFRWAARDLTRRPLGTRMRFGHSPGYGGFRGRRGREHSGARNRPFGARRCFANFCVGCGSPQKGAHHQHQRGSAEGGALGLAPGFNLRCPLVGAAPRIPNPNRVALPSTWGFGVGV